MLPKQNRLTSKYEFNKVRYLANKHNSKYSSKTFHIFFTPIPKWVKGASGNTPSKVGIVVSNKFHKSAVKRNSVKRIFREIVRTNFDKIKDGYWIVIHPKFSSINKPYEEINVDFNKTVQKLPIAR